VKGTSLPSRNNSATLNFHCLTLKYSLEYMSPARLPLPCNIFGCLLREEVGYSKGTAGLTLLIMTSLQRNQIILKLASLENLLQAAMGSVMEKTKSQLQVPARHPTAMRTVRLVQYTKILESRFLGLPVLQVISQIEILIII